MYLNNQEYYEQSVINYLCFSQNATQMPRQCRQVPVPQSPHLGVAHQRVGPSRRRRLRREVVRMLPRLVMFKSLRASSVQEFLGKQLPKVGKFAYYNHVCNILLR